MSLKLSYTLLSPIYDSIVNNSRFNDARKKSLLRIPQPENRHILINGIGTGLDIPFLNNTARYTGTDLTPAMLKRASEKAETHNIDISLIEADSMALPFEDNYFDIVVMHLILAVVPDSKRALNEASRVLKPGGYIHVIDKFLKPGEIALTKRFVNLFTQHFATRTDVVFEDLLNSDSQLSIINDDPLFGNGWFRFIQLQKNHKGD